MSRSLADGLRWTRVGTALLEEAVAGLSAADLRRPTALPGWTRAHVVAHVVANARALGNLVHWAATAERTPMYESATQRADEIERGARQPAEVLASSVSRSARALAEAMAALGSEQWERWVVTAQDRKVRASEVPWMRAREVCVHAVDLGAGATFADLPDDFLAALEEDVTARRGEVPLVDAPLPERIAWLTGRPHAVAGAPTLGPWL
jgi:maleylpyruvate isomerase